MWNIRRRRDRDESFDALADAKKHLRLVEEREPYVEQSSKKLRVLRERNHFTERLRPIMIREVPGAR